jgi:hypothetical protein
MGSGEDASESGSWVEMRIERYQDDTCVEFGGRGNKCG